MDGQNVRRCDIQQDREERVFPSNGKKMGQSMQGAHSKRKQAMNYATSTSARHESVPFVLVL